MLPLMNLTEIAVIVNVDSVGKVEWQTKGMAMCAILFSTFPCEIKVQSNQQWSYTTEKLNLWLWQNFPHLIS